MTEPEKAPLWASPLFCALIVLVLTIPRLIFAFRYGLIGDEAYYAIWSFYPGFAYFDHPPVVAWTIWLGRMLFGESVFAVRILFLAASLLTAATLYRIAVLLFADRRIGAVAAIVYSVTPAILLSFSVATPDGPSTLFWVLVIWAVAEFMRSRRPNWWLLVGLFAGLGLLSKYTVVFLAPGLLLFLLSSAERRSWFRHWQVWAAVVLAFALFAPVIWIDSQRNWDSFRFQLGRSSFSSHGFGVTEFIRFLIEEAIQLLPTLFISAVVGVAVFFARRARPLALPVLTSTPIAAYFLADSLFGRVNPNWTAPLLAMLALVGAWAIVGLRPPLAILRWPLRLLGILHVPLGVAVILAALGALEYRALPVIGPLPILNFVYGWDDLQRKVSTLAADTGARWVDVQDYSLNGLLGYYGRMAGDPLQVYQTGSPVRSQYRPPMDPALTAAPHLFVVSSFGGDQPGIDGMTPLGAITRSYEGQALATYWVYLKP